MNKESVATKTRVSPQKNILTKRSFVEIDWEKYEEANRTKGVALHSLFGLSSHEDFLNVIFDRGFDMQISHRLKSKDGQHQLRYYLFRLPNNTKGYVEVLIVVGTSIATCLPITEVFGISKPYLSGFCLWEIFPGLVNSINWSYLKK